MTKAFKLNWRKEVPEELLTGLTVERWTEVSYSWIYTPKYTVNVYRYQTIESI